MSVQIWTRQQNSHIVMGQLPKVPRVYQIEAKTVTKGQCYQRPVIIWQMREHTCIYSKKKFETGFLISQPGLELAV